MRVLLIEDSDRLRKYVAKALANAGFSVDLARDGEEGLWMAEGIDYDVVVLDLMLPKLSGSEILRRLRSGGRTVHVLILTARDTVEDRVAGLNQGADDYLVKPFAMEELIARIHSLIRRRYETKSPRIMIGNLLIDTAAKSVTRAGNPVELSPREYSLLEYLAVRKGEVVSRAEIEEHIYDDRVEPVSNVVNSAISVLRKKIDSPDQPSLIQTRRGIGYVLQAPEP